ncbi:MAG: response regulator [bacterium]|nr:response regulator [bacterium]
MPGSTIAHTYSVRTTLGTGALILGLWYALLIWIQARTLPAGPAFWISGACAITALVLIGCGLRWIQRPPPERLVDACVGGICFGILANDTLFLTFYPEPQFFHGLGAVVVGGGLFLTSRVWFGALLTSVAAVVALSVARSDATEGWGNPGVLLATCGALALIIHVWRSAFVKRLEALGRESEDRRVELERNVATLEFEVQERERLQAELLKTQNLESLGRMAGGVAHDFNNLLMIILGHAELAHAGLSATASVRGNLDEVIQAAERASLLTGQLLSYAGGGRVSLEPLELNTVVHQAVEIVRESLSSDARIEFHLAERDLMVAGDPGQLQQIVMNLLLNAGEALSGKPGLIRVCSSNEQLDRVEAFQLDPPEDRSAGHYACLEVSDTGRGIPQEDHSRIFDPFFTTKSQGRGLGLAAALGIARGHGGGFTLESAPKRGSRFRLFIPESEENSRKAEYQPVAGSLTGRAILVVDDEEAIRSFVRRVLEDFGCTIHEASNGEEALETARGLSELDAVVLDMTMPGLSSRTTFKRFREAHPCAAILLTSGYEAERAASQLVREPDVSFLRKPYVGAELAAILGVLLDGTIRNGDSGCSD